MEEKISFRAMIHIMGRALKVSLKIKTPRSLLINLLGFGAAFLPLLIAKELSNLSNIVLDLYGAGTDKLLTALTVFGVLVGLYVIQTAYVFAQNYSNATDTLKIQEYIKQSIIKVTCNVKYKYIENYDDFRDKINFSETVTGRRVAESMQAIIVWLQNLVAFITILYALLAVNQWIVILLIATCIPAIILSYNQKDEEYRFKTKWMKEGAMVIHYYGMCCAPDSMNDLRHWRVYDYVKNGWRTVAQKYIHKKNEITKKHLIYNSVADVLRNSVFIGVLLIVTYEIYQNPAVGIGLYMLVYTLSGDFQRITTNLFVSGTKFVQDIKYMRDFFEFEQYEQEQRDAQALPLKQFQVSFRKVGFTYPNTSVPVLKNINVDIKQGEKVAIVGHNGSGKTTFINLLCGIHEPDNGEVLIGGQNISENIAAARKSISVAFQDFSRYEATLRDNITISDPQRNISEQELEALCRQTGALDIVNAQANGFDEMIGIFSEKGNNLSGGQWQKIALTRAAYRSGAGIMILDEPTAALDPMAEAKLYHDFTELTGNKTTILVSHRLGVCSLVDRILVFKDGEIIEDGTHEALMEKKGYYSELYEAQSQWYR
ncbi:Lipid A export ATP-binding/permease protein MsbA [compost metagenome]